MKIVLNGESVEVGEGGTVRGLLAERELVPEKVAVEVNRRLVREGNGGYDRALAEGDAVEIVTFVGGG